MKPEQGPLELLDDAVAQRLLASTEMAHLAYDWSDGTPRCTPIWFHWNGTEVVMSSPANAPKAAALTDGTPVAVTIDESTWPYAVLLIRGHAAVDEVAGVTPEYRAAAVRYFGPEQGERLVRLAAAGHGDAAGEGRPRVGRRARLRPDAPAPRSPRRLTCDGARHRCPATATVSSWPTRERRPAPRCSPIRGRRPAPRCSPIRGQPPHLGRARLGG